MENSRSVSAGFHAGWVRSSFAALLLAIALAGGSALAASGEWTYVTRPGDTLIGIAENYLVNPQAWPVVQKRNRISDPHRIPVGTRLHIPDTLLRMEAVQASVLLVNGQANRVSSDGAERSLVAGDVLQAGDRVHVASGSNLSLRFPDGSRVLVLENSRFTLNRAVRVGKSSMHRILIDLHAGQMESNVVPSSDGAQQYEIKTPALRMSVRGTHFRAAADSGSGQARSEVLTGRVQVDGGRKAIVLGAGSVLPLSRASRPWHLRGCLPLPNSRPCRRSLNVFRCALPGIRCRIPGDIGRRFSTVRPI
jgi:Uncharacterized protein conserved in bacteria